MVGEESHAFDDAVAALHNAIQFANVAVIITVGITVVLLIAAVVRQGGWILPIGLATAAVLPLYSAVVLDAASERVGSFTSFESLSFNKYRAAGLDAAAQVQRNDRPAFYGTTPFVDVTKRAEGAGEAVFVRFRMTANLWLRTGTIGLTGIVLGICIGHRRQLVKRRRRFVAGTWGLAFVFVVGALWQTQELAMLAALPELDAGIGAGGR